MKLALTCTLLLSTIHFSIAQSKINLHGGWSASKIRVLYDESRIIRGPIFGDVSNFSWLHLPYMGFEYEYDYKRLRLSTGIVLMYIGAEGYPFWPEEQWVTAYYTIPVMAGYQLKLPSGFGFAVEGGVDVQFAMQPRRNGGFLDGGTIWGNIGAVIGLGVEYKRIGLGIKGHWGLTDFRYLGSITYKHAALTTYLSYTLWDHAKARARRLERRQAKRLNQH